MKIGLFGGTFNPPHKTHVDIAVAARNQLGLDKLVVMPCGDPPHKQVDVDKNTRMKLARLAFDGIAEVSDYELNKVGKSYTVETLAYLKELYPSADLYLIIGGDSLVSFGKWHCPKQVASLATLVVVDRARKTSTATVRRIERDYGATVVRLNFKANSVSSTEVRLRYEFGLSNADTVPLNVDNYIIEHNLYGQHRSMVDKLRGYLKPERFSHTFYVVKRGLELANDDEREQVFTACLLHDCAKYISPNDYGKYGFGKPMDMPDSVVHSFLGAEVAKRDFGVTDQDVLDAIAYHTTGKPNMSRLCKLVYVADKTEDSRPYPLSHLKRGSLDDMFVMCLVEAYQVCLERHCDSVCPLSEQTIDYYCNVDETEDKNNNIQGEKDMAKNSSSKETVQTICQLLAAKQATDIKIVEISGISDLADYFVICSGRSIPQVKAIFDHLEEQLEKQGRFAIRKEGYAEGRWIAVDYGDVIVHIFHKDTREIYSLDTLWNNGNNVVDYNAD